MSELLSTGPAFLSPSMLSTYLTNYITFARSCQTNDGTNYVKNRARYYVDAQPTSWIDPQTDGPALRILAILQALEQGPAFLDAATTTVAQTVIAQDLTYLLTWDNINYDNPTNNLWEDCYGYSIFTRAVQIKCLSAVSGNSVGVPVPPGIATAITNLTTSLRDHRDWRNQRYVSVLGSPNLPAVYDPAIDPIMAALYGSGVDWTDTLLLSTAAQVRGQWTPPADSAYPINEWEAGTGFGPLIGRFSGDTYDGDLDAPAAGHPWAVCTCNLAQLYYSVAMAIEGGSPVPVDDLTTNFWSQLGITNPASLSGAAAMTNLRSAGDAMLNDVVNHSNNLHLSEQFDATSGWEKSVSDLTWSYAAFLSAVRVRNT
jgi:glucoamylase